MSTIKVDKITGRTGSAGTAPITLSGDTVTLGSNVVSEAFIGGTTSTLDPTATTNPSAVGHYWINTTSGDTYICTDATTNANDWINIGRREASLQAGKYRLSYLVIAGGGGGGGYYRSGGGGAGGYRNSFASETSGRNTATETPWSVKIGTVITVTVGAGGANASGNNNHGGKGGDSSIAPSGQTTVTSNGGGGGADYENSAVSGTYGSGGGAGHGTTSTFLGSDGTAGQGFDGGDTPSTGNQQGGGGGGASANGDDGGSTSVGLTGGNGLSSSITGSAVVRAGGGGGGSYGTGAFMAGGAGGGGGGGSDTSTDAHSGVAHGSYYLPAPGVDGTGGGGGGVGGDSNSGSTYGKGGTGVVILRMPTVSYTGTTTGSPGVTTNGLDTILTFLTSGSYTA